MEKKRKGLKNRPAKERRKNVIVRLEAQLKKGMKPGERPVRGIDVCLDDEDIKRINKELITLKSRI